MSTQHAVSAENSGHTESGNNQFLTFILADEEYGVDILRVQEIKGMDTVTPMPDVPEHIRGVVNLRGIIVPIMDLRLGLGLEAKEYGATTVVIVVKVFDNETERTMGLIVDAVSEVYNISGDELKPPPDFGNALKTDYVKGIATVEDKMLILLDVDQLITNGLLADISTRH